ncbi:MULTISPECIES: DNA cytosine methyltransferase [unclassified Mesorhizobium]|uniref:DNA cytosine methyltransferase n=1 Tax=unclassified Mesorhizobium TaxID=325217 RepID=UPI000FEA5544|nr:MULTISPECIES: DNA (cytosine-5-)-methyltransferase [unclassified Mesorhizobium]RWH25244.1 MAG: DNA (cytosine-5-)-methyltransferase [Mesorhizobium sp.]RWH35574.1 MAG: DNA (cytosine-5-)-methyltransferase [Mesorhizobium sp.]TGS85768.1 DNA (cytosine-5-)-methyltransferase [Mesorhizobium sp. M3A.F.Ca.ET.175.01.1.1]TGT23922.1 DNA (cytosine-5-)-methyltransferase [Mesorhizobium sp. M3A.F.Ca.ET.174.01.1.1]TIM70772.1 MAG: DNA (cytosine-5-)-methyltransferase [Mesorhizobium sp.]
MSNQTVVSLFSGIGGFEVGFAKAGLQTSLMCEKDPVAQAVLRKHFPEINLVNDVTKMTELPVCDVLVGGWPCQDLSQAGRMAGMHGSQSGLVSHVFRLLDATPQKPNAIVLENVAFSLSLHKGKAVSYVTSELAARGYRWAYRVLDTREFGLPQRRRRIFIVGMLEGDPGNLLFDGIDQVASEGRPATNIGFYWTEGNRGVGWTIDAVPPLKGGSGLSIPSPPAIWTVETGLFQTPGIEDAERLQGFAPGWTASAQYVTKGDRLRWRLVGNAVSVPVATWVGKRLATSEGRGLAYQENGTETHCQHTAAWGGPKQASRYIPSAGQGPRDNQRVSLVSFGLKDAKTLSVRAAQGFLRRYIKSGLTKNQEFARALAAHCGFEEVPT